MSADPVSPIAFADLPFITPDLDGIGGVIKTEAGHFVVEEVSLYEPCGTGEHVYLSVRREGWSTRDLARALAAAFGIAERDVGYAGLKDKTARVTQAFSLPLARVSGDEIAARASRELSIEVLFARRHGNKLRRGHLLGNRFTVVVADPVADALPKAQAVAAALEAHGIPNFYGPQRLGVDGRNAARGRRDLSAPRSTFASRFALNAYQSALFNAWLADRMQRGWFERVFAGDVAKKTDTGGLFDVEDEETENARLARREITYTGPIYGSRMRSSGGEPGALERAVLDSAGLATSDFERARLEGTRRASRVFAEELSIEPVEGGLQLSFRLQKGAYATTLLREFMKREPDVASTLDDG